MKFLFSIRVLLTIMCSIPMYQIVKSESLSEFLQNKLTTVGSIKTFLAAVKQPSFKSDGQLIAGACYTTFIPTDAAFTAAGNIADTGAFASDYVYYIVDANEAVMCGTATNMQTIKALNNVADFNGYKIKYIQSTQSTYSFVAIKPGNAEFYFNSGKRLASDESSNEAVVHYIDAFPYPTWNVKFTEYLAMQSDLSESSALFNKLNEIGTMDERRSVSFGIGGYEYSTAFIPNNAAWQKFYTDSPGIKEILLNNATLLSETLSFLFCRNQVFSIRWAPDSIVVKAGFSPTIGQGKSVTLRVMESGAFVDGGQWSAKIVKPDQFFKYGIGHVIDTVIGGSLVPVTKVVQQNAPAFYAICAASATCKARMSATATSFTLFAPSNTIDYTSVTEIDKYLKLAFVNQKLTGSMIMATTGNIKTDDGFVRFSTDASGNTYMEARVPTQGFVRVRIVRFDLGGTNGIVHLVEGLPGYPVLNVLQFLQSMPDLTNFANRVSKDFEPQLDKYSSFTVFVPTTAAWTAMEADSIGKQLLNTNAGQMTVIYRRHIGLNYALIEEKGPNVRLAMPTANWDLSKEYTYIDILQASGASSITVNIPFGSSTITVNLSKGGYRCTNGIVYTIDTVMYSSSDQSPPRSLEFRSASNRIAPQFVSFLLIGCVTIAALFT